MKKLLQNTPFIIVTLFLAQAHATPTPQVDEFMITVNAQVPAGEVKAKLKALETEIQLPNGCFFRTQITQFVDHNVPGLQEMLKLYYGVAMVKVSALCAADSAKAYFEWIDREMAKGDYTIFSNPRIEGNPSFSGRN